ncbi:MAG: corA [Nitrososphaeraceae archaeon]|nr:corA [Nitrososphaeraceae archaeon]
MVEMSNEECIKMEEAAIQDHVEQINNNGNLWIDIEKPTRNKIEMLGRKFPFNELNLEDCLSKIQITKIDRYDDHIFIILHFPTSQKEKGIPRFSQLSIFAGMNYLVTVHQGDLRPLIEMFQICKKSHEQRQVLMGKSSGYLLHSIIDVLVDDLLHILMKVVGNLDDIEDAVFDDKIAVAKEISLLRREITTLRRVVIPLKRIVLEMARDIQKFSEEDIYKDTDYMLSTEKTNKILAVLTILFTLSIPATVVGAFYGMNVNLPGGSETGSWNFFGTYTTLIVVLIISTFSALLMIWYFRRLGWIGMTPSF